MQQILVFTLSYLSLKHFYYDYFSSYHHNQYHYYHYCFVILSHFWIHQNSIFVFRTLNKKIIEKKETTEATFLTNKKKLIIKKLGVRFY